MSAAALTNKGCHPCTVVNDYRQTNLLLCFNQLLNQLPWNELVWLNRLSDKTCQSRGCNKNVLINHGEVIALFSLFTLLFLSEQVNLSYFHSSFVVIAGKFSI